MTVFIFNNAVPASANNPSADQPDMLINNQSNQSIWAVDHYGFNEAPDFGGLHKQLRLPVLAAIPPGLVAGEGTIYTKTADGKSQVFFSNGNSGNEYQLTSTNDINFTTFGTYANYGVAPPAGFSKVGGWTFLAGNGGNVVTPLAPSGGLLFQYGSFYRTSFNSGAFPAGSTGTIDFPRPFVTDCFLVVATPLYNDLSAPPANNGVGNISTDYNAGTPSVTDFKYLFTTVSGGYIGFSWYAIGI